MEAIFTMLPRPTRGGISLSDGPGSDLDPWNPALQAAQRSCAKLFETNASPARQARCTAKLLRFARYVRAHGVPNFPDPSSLGVWGIAFLINRDTLDPHGPLLQAAISACERVVPVNPGFRSYG
jgi:hypothetical protein